MTTDAKRQHKYYRQLEMRETMNLRAQAIHGMALLAAAALAHAAPQGYVVNSDFRGTQDVDSLFQVDLASGDSTLIGPTGFGDIEGLALSPEGSLYGVDDNSNTLVLIDTQTGDAAPVNNTLGNLGLMLGAPYDFGLSFDADGTLWLSSDVTGQIWQVDPSTGAASLVFGAANVQPTNGPDGKSAANPGALTALAACGGDVYGLGSNGDEALYAVPGSGSGPDKVGNLQAALAFGDAGLAFDADGTLWGIADRSTDLSGSPLDMPSIIFTIDPDSGMASQVGTTLIGVESLAIAPPSAACATAALAVGGPAIPVLSWSALASLALLLLALGLLSLRSQPITPFKR